MKIENYRIFAEAKLKNSNLPTTCLLRYNESHRFYHNWGHIENMLKIANDKKLLTGDKQGLRLIIAIIYHDIIYNLKSKTNEIESAFYFLKEAECSNLNDTDKEQIYSAILDTTYKNKPTSKLGEDLCEIDLYYLYNDFDKFYENSLLIFKEYQFVDWNIYKVERIKILEKFKVNPMWIDAIKHIRPNIALFAGSFDQFHLGHYDILTKAEKIFDKVILARGQNLDKGNKTSDFPDYVKNRQIVEYDGLLANYVKKLGYDVTIIRGLRDGNDVNYERISTQYMLDENPDMKFISIFSDLKYSHFSSSAIKKLESFSDISKYLYP